MTGLDILDYESVNGVDENKVATLVESIKTNGWLYCPILTYGNTLITGSHRLAAIKALYEEDFNINFDCARDVTDIIDDKLENGMDWYDINNNLDNLSALFENTWVEKYKDMMEEW